MKRVIIVGVTGAPETMAKTESGLIIPESLAKDIEKEELKAEQKAIKDFVETLAAKSFNPPDGQLAN